MSLKSTSPPSPLARLDAQVPVTALALHGSYLLAGQDSCLCIYDSSSGALLRRRSPSAFCEQPIHGVYVNPATGAVLLWGAAVVSYLPGGWDDEREVSGKAKDWIYAGALSPAEDGRDEFGVVVTAHNDLVPVTLNDTSGALVFGQPISPSRPILYSATLTFLSPATLLVVGGTVFGEILVWRCHLDSPGLTVSGSRAEMLYTLVGHEGSIFGVDISPALDPSGTRLLASCSDDRTIRLWDITEAKASRNTTSGSLPRLSSPENPSAARETGFVTGASSTDTTNSLATAMGHASRIWGVRIVASPNGMAPGSSSTLAVYSFGEDATMQRWAVNLEASKLTHEHTFSLHDGKHLWAHALASQSDGSLLFATGGADAQITLIEEQAPAAASRCSNLVSIDVKDIIRDAPPASGLASKRAKEIITRYDFLSADELVAMTSSGRILRGAVGASASDWRIVPVEDERHAEDLGLCYALRRVGPGAVVMGTTSGSVYLYDVNRGLSLLTSLKGRIMDLISVQASSDTRDSVVSDIYVQLQGNMAPWYLTIDLSSGTLQQRAELTDLDVRFVAISALKARGYIFIGSRHGFLSVLRAPSSTEDSTTGYPVVYTLSPRSPDAISCIVEIPPDHSNSRNPPLYILTTSRDGYYCIYQFHDTSSSGIYLSLLHETPAPFSALLTGAYFITPSSATSQEPELILHGFKGREFIIHNESRRMELASINCGGAHRMHCLWTDPSALSAARLRFAFTRTSLLSTYSQETSAHRVLTPGIHGREIRTLSSNGEYLATGGEDTTIRLWSCPSDGGEQQPQPRHLATVKFHVTGLQHLQFLGPSHLLSSGGFEEFYVWRVRRLAGAQYPGVAVMREAKLDHAGATGSGDGDSDLRIMTFDAHWADGDKGLGGADEDRAQMVITMVLSDSTIKTYTYTESDGFVLYARGQYTGACLTQVRHLTGGQGVSKTQLVTGSTDGHICTWVIHRDEAGSPTYRLATATQTHQNTIKAMDMVPHDSGFLLLTGGDDNALHLSLVTPANSSSTTHHPGSAVTAEETQDYHTVKIRASILRAHAASINGVSILSRDGRRFLGASASNDQRVKLWDLGDTGQKLVLLADRYSGVADSGDVGVLDDKAGRLAIAGVGLEMWEAGSGLDL